MPDTKDSGGAAFPNNGGPVDMRGMDLRDYFAGKALPAVIQVCINDANNEPFVSYCAKKAYQMADAMMAARKGGEA